MKSRVTVVVVGIVTLFSWWLLSTEQEKQYSVPKQDQFIDAFIKNFTLISTNESGQAAYTLKAERLEHYNDKNTSQITNPTIDIPQADSHWHIRADFGEIDDKQSFIQLHDNVIMKQIGSNEAFEIKTSHMTINTNSQIIESNQLVELQNGSLTLMSNGMRYNNAKKQLRLLSDVSGTYVHP